MASRRQNRSRSSLQHFLARSLQECVMMRSQEQVLRNYLSTTSPSVMSLTCWTSTPIRVNTLVNAGFALLSRGIYTANEHFQGHSGCGDKKTCDGENRNFAYYSPSLTSSLISATRRKQTLDDGSRMSLFVVNDIQQTRQQHTMMSTFQITPSWLLMSTSGAESTPSNEFTSPPPTTDARHTKTSDRPYLTNLITLPG